MHIPDDPLYYEKFYFTPGDLGFRAFDTACGRIGTLVCWDQWYPEAARLTALAGADVLFYPTAIGWHPSEKAEYGAAQASAWQTIQRAHAIANGVYVAAVNRVGHETLAGVGGDGLEFWGGSFVADPFGQVIAEASRDQGRDADRHLRSQAPGDGPPPLAVPARPPHRRLRRDHAPAHRRMKRARSRSPAAKAPIRRRPRSASACRPSGSRTPPPGSPGRTSRATGRASCPRSTGSTARWSATWPSASACASWCRPPPSRSARATCSGASASIASACSCSPRRPTAAGRATTARSSSPTATARSPSPTGASTAGRSTPNHKRDDAVNDRIVRKRPACASGSRPRAIGKRVARVVLEGGAIDVNGSGHAAGDRGVPAGRDGAGAQPGPRRARSWRACSRAHLGVRKVLWLGRGIAGDDTHGHVDDLARFVDETHGRRRAGERPRRRRTTSRCARTARASSA